MLVFSLYIGTYIDKVIDIDQSNSKILTKPRTGKKKPVPALSPSPAREANPALQSGTRRHRFGAVSCNKSSNSSSETRVETWVRACRRPGGRPGAGTPESREHIRQRKLCSNARQKNWRGAAPKHRGGKHHTGGNSPQGNPTRQHTPHRESSTRRGPRCKIGRGGRRSSDFRVKQRAPLTAGSCSHRVAKKLYAGKEDPRTSA